jgi:hypothetical protein
VLASLALRLVRPAEPVFTNPQYETRRPKIALLARHGRILGTEVTIHSGGFSDPVAFYTFVNLDIDLGKKPGFVRQDAAINDAISL